MTSYTEILSIDDINYINSLPEVLEARNKVNNMDVVYFNITLSSPIKNKLYQKLGLDLSGVDRIPMRWIKGDTKPHVDVGKSSFDNTYLLYLTDSIGNLVLGEDSYPISKGAAYVFPENLRHETVNTGSIPRLLLGPMSEKAFAVGSGFNVPGGTTIYIRQSLFDVQYKIDDSEWINLGNNYPISIYNNNVTNGVVKVEFTTDIIFDNVNGGIYKYFICSSTDIQFGSTSLKQDGTRPNITIQGVTDYPGLIQNGNADYNGQTNIYIYNLKVVSDGSTLAPDAGWIGHSYFGKGVSNNYIINCSSTGNIPDGNGGILGLRTGEQATSLYLYGCSSSGSIGTNAGGIIGALAGNSGSITCYGCWSTGNIALNGGGIYGGSAGDTCNSVVAQKCYSTGNIGSNGGGIYGNLPGPSAGSVEAKECYSLGTLDTDAGGIFGKAAGSDGGNTSAQNCYTMGSAIYGSNKQSGTEINCYTAGGSWSNSSADEALVGTPNPIVGISWINRGSDVPYELVNIGYTPYNITNILTSPSPNLKQTYSGSVSAGGSTIAAIVAGQNYEILQKSGGNAGSYGTITINSTTGVITTTSSTVPGTYTLNIRNTGSYNTTTFELIVNGPIPCLTEDSTVLTPDGYVSIKELKKGDFVTVSDGRKVKIINIHSSVVSGHLETYPCIVHKDSLGHDYPKQDFKISQAHLIKWGEQWILPKENFPLDTSVEKIHYYHIELENYITDHLVINDGVIVESLGKGFLNTMEYYQRMGKEFPVTVVPVLIK